MWTLDLLLLVAAVFVFAGFVKGVIGLGLPTVVLALLTVAVGLKEAMALMLIPSFLTNVWQGALGGHLRMILQRLWPLLLAACLVIWLGAELLTRLDVAWLSALLGGTLWTYALVGLLAPKLPTPGKAEVWVSPLVGAVNGLLTGLTGSFVVPAVPYLQSLGLPRDAFVQAMGVLFTVSTVALAVALGAQELFTVELGVLSGLAFIPALLGMFAGTWVRGRLTESRFRRVFFLSLLVLGAYIVLRAVAG
ncbi:MAG TPA: sulfite exporter TauE/SafE family protein [Gammaproteobacteria bacterium]|nr:sulfite exporter TauE/SafE family protein [Gammaproteobacteria bacterium]